MTTASVFRLDGCRLCRDTQDRGSRAATNGQDTSGASSLELKIAASSICILMCPPGGGPQNSHCGSILPSCSCSMRVRTRNTAPGKIRCGPRRLVSRQTSENSKKEAGKPARSYICRHLTLPHRLAKSASSHVAANLQSFNEDHRTVDEDQTRSGTYGNLDTTIVTEGIRVGVAVAAVFLTKPAKRSVKNVSKG